jgi:hypothetical protein
MCELRAEGKPVFTMPRRSHKSDIQIPINSTQSHDVAHHKAQRQATAGDAP